MQKNKIVTVWALVITMSVIALAVGWFAITRHHPPANAQTVEEAIAGGVLQIENPYSPTNVDDEDRMYSLRKRWEFLSSRCPGKYSSLLRIVLKRV